MSVLLWTFWPCVLTRKLNDSLHMNLEKMRAYTSLCRSIVIRAIRKVIRSLPVLGSLLAHPHEDEFRSSADYWEWRYRDGGNSGVGSYDQLAQFKASFLNRFVADHQVASVIEFGSGDGSQLKLARYLNYIGVDVSPTAVEMCRSIFSADSTKLFYLQNEFGSRILADLTLSLDVIYHLVEDPVFETYMRQLFHCARRFVIVYSSNFDEFTPVRHVRHRQFTRWIEQNEPEWCLHSTVKNAYPFDAADLENTSFADFYVFKRCGIPDKIAIPTPRSNPSNASL